MMSLKLESARFSRSVAKFVKALPGTTEEALREIVLELLKQIILLNPVDYGRSRAGWSAAGELLGVHVPSATGLDEPMSSSEFGEAKITANGTTATMTFTNGVEYTVDLERGTSRQAPHGMVRVSMRIVEGQMSGRNALPKKVLATYAAEWGEGKFRAIRVED